MNPPRADRVQTALWAGVGLAFVGLFYLLSPILTPFVVAAVFAYALAPLVRRLDRRGGGRLTRLLADLLVQQCPGDALTCAFPGLNLRQETARSASG